MLPLLFKKKKIFLRTLFLFRVFNTFLFKSINLDNCTTLVQLAEELLCRWSHRKASASGALIKLVTLLSPV